MEITTYDTAKERFNLENISLLHIDNEKTTLTQGLEDAENITFGIGAQQIASEFFSNFPPTPDETERAIMLTEDSIMPFAKQIQKDNQLVSCDTALNAFASLMNLQPKDGKISLPRTDMEILFGRLSALITGRPLSSDILPDDTVFAARLLILREIMHHFGFKDIILLAESM